MRAARVTIGTAGQTGHERGDHREVESPVQDSPAALDDSDFAGSGLKLARTDRRSDTGDGILNRLVHNAHRIEMRGDSMRKNQGKPNARWNGPVARQLRPDEEFVRPVAQACDADWRKDYYVIDGYLDPPVGRGRLSRPDVISRPPRNNA
jgi:hypothetical protein